MTVYVVQGDERGTGGLVFAVCTSYEIADLARDAAATIYHNDPTDWTVGDVELDEWPNPESPTLQTST